MAAYHQGPMKHNDPGMKFDAGKPSAGLLPGAALLEVAKVLDFGAQKYAAHNWRKGMRISRLYDAALRHMFAIIDGELIDPESGLHHAAHASCCLLFALDLHKTKPEFDDVYRKPEPSQPSTTNPKRPSGSKRAKVR